MTIERALSFPLDVLPPSPLPHAIDRTVGWEGLGLDRTPTGPVTPYPITPLAWAPQRVGTRKRSRWQTIRSITRRQA